MTGAWPNPKKRILVESMSPAWAGSIFRAIISWGLRICAGWRPAPRMQSPELGNTEESRFWKKLSPPGKVFFENFLYFFFKCVFLKYGKESWLKAKKKEYSKMDYPNSEKRYCSWAWRLTGESEIRRDLRRSAPGPAPGQNRKRALFHGNGALFKSQRVTFWECIEAKL